MCIRDRVKALSARGGEGFVLFPFYGQIDTPHLKTRWFFPPFFRFSHAGDQLTCYMPWPFVQWAEGTVDKHYLWPIVGRKKVGDHRSGFLVWPIIKWDASGNEIEGSRRLRVAPVYQFKKIWNASESIDKSEWKVWPLARGMQKEDCSLIEVLACLLYTSPSPRDATLSRMPSSA